MGRKGRHLSKKTIITDVGSTKYNVLTKANNVLGKHFKNFIGSHPIAGSEKHGPEAAQESLFHDKNIFPHLRRAGGDPCKIPKSTCSKTH